MLTGRSECEHTPSSNMAASQSVTGLHCRGASNQSAVLTGAQPACMYSNLLEPETAGCVCRLWRLALLTYGPQW